MLFPQYQQQIWKCVSYTKQVECEDLLPVPLWIFSFLLCVFNSCDCWFWSWEFRQCNCVGTSANSITFNSGVSKMFGDRNMKQLQLGVSQHLFE